MLCLLFHAPRQGILCTLGNRANIDVAPLKLDRGFRVIPLRTLVSLPPSERGLVLRTLPLVAAIRVALWLAPLQRVRRLIRACERLPFSVPADLPVARLEWAVRAVSRRVPMASCLTQALALQFLLVRSGRSAEVHIGVRKDTKTGFQSHAWVECEGRMLLSEPSEIIGYSRLLALGARPD
jgi:hypothetical protein